MSENKFVKKPSAHSELSRLKGTLVPIPVDAESIKSYSLIKKKKLDEEVGRPAFKEFKKKALADKETKEAYDRLKNKYALISELLDAQKKTH